MLQNYNVKDDGDDNFYCTLFYSAIFLSTYFWLGLLSTFFLFQLLAICTVRLFLPACLCLSYQVIHTVLLFCTDQIVLNLLTLCLHFLLNAKAIPERCCGLSCKTRVFAFFQESLLANLDDQKTEGVFSDDEEV